MQYLGGKSDIAGRIANLLPTRWEPRVWEPFCGGCSVSVRLNRLCGTLLCSDIHKPLIAMWKALQEGWTPPRKLTEEDYQRAKMLPDSDPLKAFAEFGCSFGGKSWGGFAGQEYVKTSRQVVIDQGTSLYDVTFQRFDFLSGIIPGELDIIYCDPPYASTESYSAVGEFNHPHFWDVCRAWASCGVDVYVSEYTAPEDAECVWAKSVPLWLDAKANTRNARIEKLFHMKRTGPVMKLPDPPDTIFAVLP